MSSVLTGTELAIVLRETSQSTEGQGLHAPVHMEKSKVSRSHRNWRLNSNCQRVMETQREEGMRTV